MGTAASTKVKVADEVWIATALLHREHPDREDFTVAEIVERALKEGLTAELRPGVYVHALQHCVANRPPNPGRYRVLTETGEGRRRLYRESDSYHPDRYEGKSVPDAEEIPAPYRKLLDWYHKTYAKKPGNRPKEHPILKLWGLGKEIWEGVDPDEYVRQLREGWK